MANDGMRLIQSSWRERERERERGGGGGGGKNIQGVHLNPSRSYENLNKSSGEVKLWTILFNISQNHGFLNHAI